MGKKDNALTESTNMIGEIENNLQRVLIRRRQEIESELEERIRREKEESDKRLKELEKEFEKEKEALDDYRAFVSDFEGQRDMIQSQMKARLNKAIEYQKDIEKLTGQTLEELKGVSDLSLKLEELHLSAQQKADVLKKNLKDKFGISTETLGENDHGEIVVNLDQELDKLKKIKELLDSEKSAQIIEEFSVDDEESLEPELIVTPAQEPEEPQDEEPPQTQTDEVEVKVEEKDYIEIEETPDLEKPASIKDALGLSKPKKNKVEEAELEVVSEEKIADESDLPIPEMYELNEQPQPEEMKEDVAQELPAARPVPEENRVVEDRSSGRVMKDEVNFQAIFERLEQYRKSEASGFNGEIGYFQNNDKVILDGESIIRSLGVYLDEAKKLYVKLAEAKSPKDQFFIKQDLINQQEILRKLILKGVQMCEKESCSLPQFTAGVLSVDILTDVLERLNMGNWSNQDDFSSFEKFAERLKDDFYKKITPPALYLSSIVNELEG